MVRTVASLLPELEAEDHYLLSGVEQGMRFSEWVDREKLPEFSGLTAEEVDYRLERAATRGLVERKTIQYEGYRLTFEGYDVLALHTFAERDTIDGFGASLGVGKESDVFEVRSYKPLALKFHREGYTNFRAVDRGRDYTADREHSSWFYTARKAAEREYETLEALYPDVSVPRPIDQNRHAIVMEQMEGVELSRARLEPDQATAVLDMVIGEVARAYDAGYVHGDLSEYNVFVAPSGVTVFDWPQAVPVDHDNAEEILERDLRNVVAYVRRKHPEEVPDAIDVHALAAGIREDDLRPVVEYAD